MKKIGMAIILFVGITALIALYILQKGYIQNDLLKDERLEFITTDEHQFSSQIDPTDERFKAYDFEVETMENGTVILSVRHAYIKSDPFAMDRFIEKLNYEGIEVTFSDMHINDYSRIELLLREQNRLLQFLTQIFIFVFIVIALVMLLKRFTRWLSLQLKYSYAKDIFTQYSVELMEVVILLSTMILGGLVVLQWLVRFQFSVNQNDLDKYPLIPFLNYEGLTAHSEYGALFLETAEKVNIVTLIFVVLLIIVFIYTIRLFKHVIRMHPKENAVKRGIGDGENRI